MKTKITAYCFAIALFFSSCAKETFTFSNTGTSYGSKKQTTSIPTSHEATPEVTSLATAEATTPAENLTASTQQTIALTKKDFIKAKPLHVTQITAKQDKNQEFSKLTQLKAAHKVNKEIKTLVKQAEKKMPAATAEGEGKSQVVALILAILVGALGIHRFYLGYTGIAIVQLLTLGGCGVWALIDLIRIAMDDLKPKDGDYTKKL